MLEESRMDKKSINRSSQAQSRASAVDCKKSSESTQKPLPRYNKKREGFISTPKNEPYRKNVPTQRGRGQVDRRPRTRGSSGIPVGGTENTGIAEDDPELGSVFVPGSKKQNLNHLLNFMYTPRGVPERRNAAQQRYMPHRVMTHPHNNDLYLQACCQFVVKDDGDYKINLLDPDVPVKWEQIVEIVVRSTGKSECPICLATPTVGRVGRCGHVYCWPCALRYAATHERQPPPCPVCTSPLRVEQMKPARILQWDSPSEEISMCLVRRLRGSTVVEVAPTRGEINGVIETGILPLCNINNAPYSKLFAADKQQMIDVVQREIKELEQGILDAFDEAEVEYMNQAMKSLKAQEIDISTQNIKLDLPKVNENTDNSVPTVFEKQTINDSKIDWFDEDEGAACLENIQEKALRETIEDQVEDLAIGIEKSCLNPVATEFEICEFGEGENVEFPYIEHAPTSDDDVDNSNNLTEIDKENQSKYFYFYQAEDGQHVFLNSLNVRILNASWGALAAAPTRIRGRVLHRETLSLVEQTRKHMPYTAHLPLHCPFDIVEIDLQPPFVTKFALKSFADDLERRARTRARNERDERRRERAYRRAMEGPPKPDFSSELLFPPTSPLQYSSPPFEESTLPPGEVTYSSPPSGTPSQSGLSFAKMAGSSGTWRVRAPPREEPPVVADEAAPGAPRALSLSDAIEAALHAAPTVTKAGKKKKSKPKVLFATGMQHAG